MQTDETNTSVPETSSVTPERYRGAVRAFDAAVCQALAVGQASSGRLESARIGFATKVFTRICAHSTAFVRATPKSRWVHSESEFWEFAAVSGHARSIIEGYLLFHYVGSVPESPDEWLARVNVMNLNDCTRRIQVLESFSDPEQIQGLGVQAEEVREKLRSNPWFRGLENSLQRKLLTGEYLTISSRNQQLDELGWNKQQFYSIWNVLSQYTHVLPFSFYRIEANGRGTGLENAFDRSYIFMVLEQCTAVLNDCVAKMVEWFPDVADQCLGINSKFSPGPTRNLPKDRKRKDWTRIGRQ